MTFWGFFNDRLCRYGVLPTCCAAAALLVPESSRADFFIHHWENHYNGSPHPAVDTRFHLYSTTENYDNAGGESVPMQFQGIARYVVDAELSYPLIPQLNAFARVSWMSEKLDHATAGGTGYGFGDQSIGLSYRLLEVKKGEPALPGAPRSSVDLQFQADLPAYSNDKSAQNGTPFLGDGSLDVTAGAFGSVPIASLTQTSAIFLTGGAGFTYRTLSFSAAIPFAAGLRLSTTPGFYGSLMGVGFYSLGNDSAVSGGVVRSNGAGGSALVYAANSSLLTGRAEAGYQTQGRLAFFGAFGQSVWGQNSPRGTTVSAGLKIDLAPGTGGGSTAVSTPNPARLSAQEHGKANKGFVSYNLEARVDRVNDRLNLLKINRGSADGVEVGQMFDIFSVRPDGQVGEPVARAKISSIKVDEAALTITEYFKEVWINEGFIARRVVH